MSSSIRTGLGAAVVAGILLALWFVHERGPVAGDEGGHTPLQVPERRSGGELVEAEHATTLPTASRDTAVRSEVSDPTGGPASLPEPPGEPLDGYLKPSRTPEEWRVEFEGAGWEELLEKADAITEFITEQTREELDRRMNAGTFRVISTDGKVSGLASGEDRLITGLDRVMILESGEVRRFQVPREHYPDLYTLADKANWLRDTAFRLRYEASR